MPESFRASNSIHDRAFIDPTATIGEDVAIGAGSVVMAGVTIGRGARIGSQVVIHDGSIIGENVRLDDLSVIGKRPMKAALSAVTKERNDLPPARIGDACVIGTHVVVYRGAIVNTKVLLADFVSVREDVEIGDMTIVGRGVAIENRVRIGARCKIETNAYVTAISEIGDGCFIAPMVTFTNDNFMARTKDRFKYHKGVTMKNGARVGANATILPGITIHEDGVVAAGSVVTKDVAARTIVLGSPAKPFRDVPEDQLLENQ